MTRPALLPLAAALLCAACATKPPAPVQKQPFPSFDPDARSTSALDGNGAAGAAKDAVPANVDAIDPAAWAKRNPRPEFCEEGARRLQKSSRNKAWEVLKACVNRGKFTLLARLVDGAWTDDLQKRPDAAQLLAKVIAARGGDVNGDLGQMRQQRIPLFALGPAMGHPDLYRGRLVLFRAEVKDVKLAAGKATAKLAEFALGISERYVADSRIVERGSSAYTSSDGPNAYGDSAWTLQFERKFQKNEPVPTGLETIARLGKPDPFFEPGRQFVVLGRFDGVREEEGEELDSVTRLAVVSVIAYYEPNASIVE
jgi:hypothetical protein